MSQYNFALGVVWDPCISIQNSSPGTCSTQALYNNCDENVPTGMEIYRQVDMMNISEQFLHVTSFTENSNNAKL